jgi:hypothetical protein
VGITAAVALKRVGIKTERYILLFVKESFEACFVESQILCGIKIAYIVLTCHLNTTIKVFGVEMGHSLII